MNYLMILIDRYRLKMEGFCIEGLKDYQFRQTTKDTFEMYAETDRSASREYIRQELPG